MAEHIRAGGSRREISADLGHLQQDPGSTNAVLLGQVIRNTNSANVPSVIREIEIWRAAVLMLSRYAGDAEANSFRRAVEPAAEGDHAGAAIWRRITVAIEQLTDPTGLPN